MPAQFIVIAGYVSRAMYFIRRGKVQVIRKTETELLLQACHDYFDVMGLFTDRQHHVSVRSLTHTDLYKLPRDAFDRIVKDYPAQGIAVANNARSHLKPVHAEIAAKRMYELVGMPSILKRFVGDGDGAGGGWGGKKKRFNGRRIAEQLHQLKKAMDAQAAASSSAAAAGASVSSAASSAALALPPPPVGGGGSFGGVGGVGGVGAVTLAERRRAERRRSEVEAGFTLDGRRLTVATGSDATPGGYGVDASVERLNPQAIEQLREDDLRRAQSRRRSVAAIAFGPSAHSSSPEHSGGGASGAEGSRLSAGGGALLGIGGALTATGAAAASVATGMRRRCSSAGSAGLRNIANLPGRIVERSNIEHLGTPSSPSSSFKQPSRFSEGGGAGRTSPLSVSTSVPLRLPSSPSAVTGAHEEGGIAAFFGGISERVFGGGVHPGSPSSAALRGPPSPEAMHELLIRMAEQQQLLLAAHHESVATLTTQMNTLAEQQARILGASAAADADAPVASTPTASARSRPGAIPTIAAKAAQGGGQDSYRSAAQLSTLGARGGAVKAKEGISSDLGGIGEGESRGSSDATSRDAMEA